MGLTLVTNPKFDKKVKYTHDQIIANFNKFLNIAKEYKSFSPVGEYYALINEKDYNKFAEAISYVWGSELIEYNTTENMDNENMVVYATKNK